MKNRKTLREKDTELLQIFVHNDKLSKFTVYNILRSNSGSKILVTIGYNEFSSPGVSVKKCKVSN